LIRATSRNRSRVLACAPASALDLGTGSGAIALVLKRQLPRTHIVAVEASAAALAVARRNAAALGLEVDFRQGRWFDRVPGERFDVVVSNGVIDLIPDKDAVFSEIFRVLAPGGRIQIADVTIQRPVSEEGKKNIDLWTG